MATSTRKKRAKRVGRPRREGLDPSVGAPVSGSSPASLPPLGVDSTALTAPISLSEGSLPAPQRPQELTEAQYAAKARALQIVAHRAAGLEDEAIAAQMGISPKSIGNMLYRAGQMGWLSQDASLYDPKDRFEYQVGHKVIDRLSEALDSLDPRTRTTTALKLTEFVLQRKGDASSAAPQLPPAIVAIKIEHVNTGPIREGTVKGVAAFLEGETV